ncbi:MAG: glycosyl hydrolase [Methanococcaceae archaeon]
MIMNMIGNKALLIVLFVLVIITPGTLKAQGGAALQGKTETGKKEIRPVNPDLSPEARGLLEYLYNISGKKILTGTHNQLGHMSSVSDRTYEITGKYPAIWGGDFGFSDSSHDIDNINYRSLLIPEIKKQYSRGAVIVITYHQANPAIGEPCPFEGGVISKLTDQQWKEILTPGTELYLKWRAQMDLFAFYLSQLRDAHIPIIFRPYHEMNGNWFWWGGRPGKEGSAALWKQIFEYYTKVHKLNNIIWAWTPDKPWEGVEDYYPGDEYTDILGTDIYPMKERKEVYPQEWYDRMFRLAKGKPLGLSENSILPDTVLLKTQPWVWFMSWAGSSLNSSSNEAMIKLYQSEEAITSEELPDFNSSRVDVTNSK